MDEEKQNRVLQKLLHSDTGRKAVVAFGLLGILLIFLSSVLPSGTKSTGSTQAASSATAQTTDEAYAKQLEQELTETIGRIRGAGTPHVLVTLEQGSAQVYAQEEKHSTQQQDGSSGTGQNADSTETGYIIVKDADGNEHALQVTRQQPKVQGVVVTCPGAEQPTVQQAILNAVSVAAGVDSTRVCVVASGG
ncbi:MULTISPECIES: stage III sporulation protein AG [Caproicibacterium]|uniref:Stage III sporulation protein AG n=1 Tax=Caproicibacterium argilliputei TaxID=3030016 RepID=A0AA97DBP6_9FIRM|nr:stage III sporulation protein AG [Caproicibacterium argilliputei]WOC33312.1 stage III sporulation protein AG [Caproicibacterium argilliputei]